MPKHGRKFSQKEIEDYLKLNGFACVNRNCRSHDLQAGRIKTDEDGHLYQEVVCCACGSEWCDVYTLTRIEQAIGTYNRKVVGK